MLGGSRQPMTDRLAAHPSNTPVRKQQLPLALLKGYLTFGLIKLGVETNARNVLALSGALTYSLHAVLCRCVCVRVALSLNLSVSLLAYLL